MGRIPDPDHKCKFSHLHNVVVKFSTIINPTYHKGKVNRVSRRGNHYSNLHKDTIDNHLEFIAIASIRIWLAATSARCNTARLS